MDDKIKHFLNILVALSDREEHELYLVGGTVRDLVLGQTSADYDFTTPVAPRLAKLFAHQIQCPIVPLDDTPGRETFRVVIDKQLYFDFSRLQGKTLNEDLGRRDFTFNAMAIALKDFLNDSKRIIDPHGGIDDLSNRRIRVLPGPIFTDDPLRMLRAFRFASALDFAIEPETLDKIGECKSQLSRIASERIHYELSLFLNAKKVYPLLITMDESGLLDYLLPEIANLRSNPAGSNCWRRTLLTFQTLETILQADAPDHIVGMVESLGDKECSSLKLAAILHRSQEAAQAMKRLRASKAEIVFIEKTVKGQEEALAGFEDFNLQDESKIYRFIRQCGNELIPALLLALASYGARNSPEETTTNPFALSVLKVYDFYVRRYLSALDRPTLLNGDDLIKLFNIAPSARFKTILEQIEENRVLGIIKTRKEAESLAKSLIDIT